LENFYVYLGVTNRASPNNQNMQVSDVFACWDGADGFRYFWQRKQQGLISCITENRKIEEKTCRRTRYDTLTTNICMKVGDCECLRIYPQSKCHVI